MRCLIRLLVVSFLCCPLGAFAGDSPQFRGPHRDGKFAESGLMKSWPEGGPPVAWVAKGLGKGYASASVVGDSIYVPGMLGDDKKSSVFVLDLQGHVKSTFPHGTETLDHYAPGPRSTPTIDGDRLYIMTSLGVVSCHQLPEGKKLWEVDTHARFPGEKPSFRIAESVLVFEGRVICTPGGTDAGVVALDKMTGETRWTSKGFTDPAAFCSPYPLERGGRAIAVTKTAAFVVGLDARSGDVLWRHAHEAGHDVQAVTPVYADGMLYYTSGGKAGGAMLELSEDGGKITPRWTDKTLDCQHHGVVLVDGYIYGTAQRSGGYLACLELKSGKVMWTSDVIEQGAVVYADGMLYVYEGPKQGIVSLVKASPAGFERCGQFTVTEGTDYHWAHPTISGGHLYIRHGDALVAYDIRGRE